MRWPNNFSNGICANDEARQTATLHWQHDDGVVDRITIVDTNIDLRQYDRC